MRPAIMEAEDGYCVRLDKLRQTLARNRAEIAKLNGENKRFRRALREIADGRRVYWAVDDPRKVALKALGK